MGWHWDHENLQKYFKSTVTILVEGLYNYAYTYFHRVHPVTVYSVVFATGANPETCPSRAA